MNVSPSIAATTSKSKKVALYARVSTDGQSTENQLRELRNAIARHGWSTVAEYVDRGVSGGRGRKDRPRFDALLNGVARKEFHRQPHASHDH